MALQLLDLSEAKATRLFPEQKTKKRTMSPENTPAILGMAGKTGFAAAKLNRLTEDWMAMSRSADNDLFGDNRRLRARARKLAIDNPHARKFLQMVKQNVVGPRGIQLQAKITNANGKMTAQTKKMSAKLEEAWNAWGEKGSCTADGKFNFTTVQQMAVVNAAREGENIAKKVYGRQFNPFGFALQAIDNDQLDDTMMVPGQNGSEIRMGVEVDRYRRPLAYWLWDGHPYDILGPGYVRRRVPADQVIHTYQCERPAQTRGYTWMSAAMLELNMYGKYNEAELVAARASAAKFMVIETDGGDGYTGEDEDAEGDDINSDGTLRMSANAGEALVLDQGQKANFIDPKHPTQAFRDFTRTALRNIASGLLVSYPNLANDLENVNFSSIRAGLLDERDCWRIIQAWFIDDFLKPVYYAWVEMAKLTVLADLNLTPEQWKQVGWKARGWEWVDPLKDGQAAILKLQNGLTTYADELGKQGLDFEETIDERAREQKYIEKAGLKMGTDIRGIADSADDVPGATDGKGSPADSDEDAESAKDSPN
jgi:lambda family phage portal protein